ncbi:MAG: STAS domain-containing protein [Micrococcales bacterium]|nr:STAS domain-containing protein [Micrococcales bacterium]
MTIRGAIADGCRITVAEAVEGQQVTVHGRIAVAAVPDLRLALHRVVDSGVGDVLVDLTNAEIHDSTGLGMLLECHHRARRAGRRFVVTNATPRSLRLIRALRLERSLLAEVPPRPARQPASVSSLSA